MAQVYKQSKKGKKLPRVIVDESPGPVCTRYSRCRGCPYPAHGFICWHEDDGCLRTFMSALLRPEEVRPT